MKLKQLFFIIVTAIFCITLSSCAKNPSPGNYDVAEVGKLKKAVPGVIISMRPIYINEKTTTVTKDADDQLMGDSVKRKRGYEYVVKLANGEIVSIVQDEELNLKVRQHILVITGDNARIVPDDGSDD